MDIICLELNLCFDLTESMIEVQATETTEKEKQLIQTKTDEKKEDAEGKEKEKEKEKQLIQAKSDKKGGEKENAKKEKGKES